jgi:2-oxoglutarate ferredoxin oxidoreductase subunit beta
VTEELLKYFRQEVFPTPFCPGCGHGILMGAIVRAIHDIKMPWESMLFASGIGCGAWIPSPHYKADTLHTLHGRPVAFATGAKLFNPKLNVVVISGDGDLAAIGGNHLIHAARRNVNMTVICANNQIYGMTGGQAAPTTVIGDITDTTPWGNQEPPFDLSKLVAGAGAKYVARYSVTQIHLLLKALKTALQTDGFSFVEVLSPCPTQYGKFRGIKQVQELYHDLKTRLVSQKAAASMSQEELKGKYITGEFVKP